MMITTVSERVIVAKALLNLAGWVSCWPTRHG
jgi:hypothetical protein